MLRLPDGEKNRSYVYSFLQSHRTWQTDRRRDGRTDRQTPRNGIGRACIALRGKNSLLLANLFYRNGDIHGYKIAIETVDSLVNEKLSKFQAAPEKNTKNVLAATIARLFVATCVATAAVFVFSQLQTVTCSFSPTNRIEGFYE